MIATMEKSLTVNEARPDIVVASLEGVNKNYGSIRALTAVDFQVQAGEVVALLGPNGAGKTTAVKLLLGLMQPNSGKVRVFGGDPTNPENRMRTGAMLQVGRVPETLRVREHIELFSSYYEKPMRAAEVLAAAGLEKLSDRKFGDLSGGQKQRVLFALAICGDPDLLFLDEPTVGLDVEARRMLWDEIRRLVGRGKTVLLTTHYLQEAEELCDRIAIINHGQVIANRPTPELLAMAQEKAVTVTVDRDLSAAPQAPCFEKIELKNERSVVITYSKDKVNAGEVLAALQSEGLGIVDVSTHEADLEDVFLNLTRAPVHG